MSSARVSVGDEQTPNEQAVPTEQQQPENQTSPAQNEEQAAQRRPTSENSSRKSSKVHRRTTEIMTANPDLDEEEEKQRDAQNHITGSQFIAMFYRRGIYIKRTIGSFIANIIVTLVVSCLAIIVKVLMDSIVSDNIALYDFDAYEHKSQYIVIVGDDFEHKYFQRRYRDVIKYLFKLDTGKDPIVKSFASVEEADKWIYDCKTDNSETQYVTMGIVLPSEYKKEGGNQLTMMWNDTVSINMDNIKITNESYIGICNLYRVELAMLTMPPSEEDLSDPEYLEFAFGDSTITVTDEQKAAILQIWKENGFDGNPSLMDLTSAKYTGQGKDLVFSMLSPLLIAAGISSVISTMIVTPINDIQGPIRAYMVSCNLEILPYWLVTFIMDYILWLIDVTLVWLLFVICDIKCFSKNLNMSYYIFSMSGFSFILYIYVLSFAFKDANNASRNAFILNIVLLIIPIIISLVTIDMDDPITSLEDMEWLNWIYSFFPPLLLEGYMQNVFIYYSYNTEGIKYYFKKESSARMYSYFTFIDIVLYGFILFIIEYSRIAVQRKAAHSNFGDYGDFFKEAKAKHPVTPEADEMAKEVENNHDYAVRIENVSRLFFNTEGKPIPAVNCVSLGVKKGSLFGFLGANGAGKTTLMNMITSMLPISDGKIEINGKDITVENDPSLLSVCPQFNTHLCMDMTIAEHLHFYSLLHRMSPEHEKRNSERLLKLLDLTAFKDIPIRELSEGDVRKLSIALSFLGRAKIILLDEPTATLDPVSRRQVHEMILYYKGQKTFMLCTHLLSEAEALCDTISIMIKGNVYTVGSPQYLSSKFGTDFKVDMMLNDESEETGKKVDAFFEKVLPQAALSIKRPQARIYNVPAASIRLGELFGKMEEGKQGDNGFNYYTCSSSSLEKVFMEIVRISEGGEGEQHV